MVDRLSEQQFRVQVPMVIEFTVYASSKNNAILNISEDWQSIQEYLWGHGSIKEVGNIFVEEAPDE